MTTSYRIQGATGEWEVVIGLEVHAQVTSNAKLFSGAATAFGAEPNSQVSLVDAAMPGMLPVPNRECIRQAVRTGMAIEAQINGQAQRLPIRLNKSASRGWAVEADRFAALPEPAVVAPTPQVAAAPVAAVSGERISRPLDRRLRFSLDGLLRSPSRYENLTMRASTTRGSMAVFGAARSWSFAG